MCRDAGIVNTTSDHSMNSANDTSSAVSTTERGS
jgi:hypothetical protein